MDKNGVRKEAQDDALSDDISGGRQTPTGRPTRGNVAPTTVFFCLCLFAVSGGEDFEFFFGVSHQRESGNTTCSLEIPLTFGASRWVEIEFLCRKRKSTVTSLNYRIPPLKNAAVIHRFIIE